MHTRAYFNHLSLLTPTRLVSYLCLLSALFSIACDDDTKKGAVTGGEASGGEIMAGEVAGEIAVGGEVAGEVAGAVAGEVAGEIAGEMAGTMAGTMAGMTAGEMAGVEIPADCLERPNPSPQTSWREEAQCQAAGEGLKIRHLRDPRCPSHVTAPESRPGLQIALEGVVVTRVFEDKLSIQDAEGGAYSGLWVFNSQQAPFDVNVGDVLYIEGEMIEFFSVTELIVRADGINVIGQQAPPAPIYIEDASRIADGGDLVEALESVLVELEFLSITNTVPDCPRDFGMFVVNQSLRISPEIELDYTPSQGDLITSVTGVLHYSFDHQKLLVGMEGDLSSINCGGIPDKCEASECRVEVDAPESGQVIITEIQNNPNGEDELREYVELFNPNATPVSITGWTLQSCSDQSTTLQGEIPARGHYVVASSLDRQANGGVDAQAELGELFLPNGYGSVLLFNAADMLVDQVRYAPGGEGWPTRRSGEALELLEPAADNRDGAAWVAGDRSYGDGGKGSPGEATR